MAFKLQRRSFLQLAAGATASFAAPLTRATAAGNDAATIGWPNDVPTWDPNQRFTPDAQPIFKAVFDQPLDQDPQLKLIPHLIKSWTLAPDALSMAVELRDDVTFHNGDKMTTEDFRYTFFERIDTALQVPQISTAGSYPRKYVIRGPGRHPFAAYQLTVALNPLLGQYYDIQGTTWTSAL